MNLSDLMTPAQVRERLESGECPIKLSIEHWEENKRYVTGRPEGEDVAFPLMHWGAKTCALCQAHSNNCSACALKNSRRKCTSSWHCQKHQIEFSFSLNEFTIPAANRQKWTEAVDALLAELRAALEAKND